MKHLTLAAAGLALSAGLALAEPREVRIASHVSEFSPLHAQSVLFAEAVEARLPGQFEFKLFPSGQLGKEKDLMTNIQAGSLEMINVASGVMKLDRKLGVFDLPWLFADRDHVRRAMAAGLEDAIRARIEEVGNMKVIGVYENGFRHVINAERAITEPFDLEGLKIRISGGKFRQQVFQNMGATPQKVSWGETFTAMQTGVVDGAEAATYGFYEQKHFEVAGYLSLTGHVYTPSFLLASNAFFDSLTPKQQAVFVEVGREITDAAYDSAAALEAKYFEEMKALIEINEVDLAAFKAATAESYADYEESQGEEYLAIIRGAQ
ncbi:DctP family TRAP transporter solute-binding subunit [Paralimibaculum aggregatum]|uniref:DctP family TRAP transporter solute-binding subunit n=1 Tax=Paralimibaculum aggregatum TaxID=3036245 RepID=A0ABQ6LJH7_9RHOB|nr:TRAP transporter substrate-binding protein [Limibaculum sp. NKW23]GMG83127.1 DctP family TRAP transporter solute-binding subunit [Limibaculum sp. NKW23]